MIGPRRGAAPAWSWRRPARSGSDPASRWAGRRGGSRLPRCAPWRSALVHAEVVEHHDLAGTEGRDQYPFHEGLEDQPVDGTPHQQALAETRRRQGRQPGDRLSPSARDRAVRPLPTRGTRPQRRQGRGGAGLIEKDQPGRIDSRSSPPATRHGPPRRVRRRSGSFFESQPEFGEQPTQVRGAEVNAGSGETSRMLGQRGIGVRQDHLAQLRIAGRTSFGGRPERGFSASDSPRRWRARQRNIVRRSTPNSRAASPGDNPASRAVTKRSRKSAEGRGAMPHPATEARLMHAALMA